MRFSLNSSFQIKIKLSPVSREFYELLPDGVDLNENVFNSLSFYS